MIDDDDDDGLEQSKTISDYVDELFLLSGKIKTASEGTTIQSIVDDLTLEIDEILIEIRHARWNVESDGIYKAEEDD